MTPTITLSRVIVEDALDALRELLPDERDPNCGGYDARDVRKWRVVAKVLHTAIKQAEENT